LGGIRRGEACLSRCHGFTLHPMRRRISYVEQQPLPPGWITPARRRSPRIAHYDYSSPGTYFVTICTHERACLFGNFARGEMVLTDIGRIVDDCWSEIPQHHTAVALDLYVVMPNHLHGLLSITPPRGTETPQTTPNLNAIVGSFKSAATRRVNASRATPGVNLWQRAYYDHAVRTEKGLERIREYIANNPLKWELDEYNPERRRARRR